MLIRNASLLHGRELDYLQGMDVRIKGKMIEKVGKKLERQGGETVLDCEGLLIMPGLVNSHTHIGDSIGKDVGINSSVETKIHPVGGFKQKILQTSKASHLSSFIKNSCLSMLRKGITTFVDFREGGLEGVELLKEASSGVPIRPVILGRVNYYQDWQLIRKNSPLPESKKSDLAGLVRHCDGLGISGPNEFSNSVLGYFARQKTLRAIHSAETAESNTASKRLAKKTETQRAMLARPHLLVHMTHASKSDLLLAARSGTTIAVCPRANGALAEGIPDVHLMLEAGCNVTIGTDNVMINSPDMFREMDYLWKACMGMNRERASPKSILQMATTNASALLGGKIGIMQKNSFADCIFVEKHSIDLDPMHNPHASVVHRVSESSIRAVMFEGGIAHGKI
ncbi:MAG TPA: amidohydrolase family protein [Candidatus Nitrosotalea sp.]|nr:amidohydrolase family protein [Candidatus Nitrosotalea sp.]